MTRLSRVSILTLLVGIFCAIAPTFTSVARADDGTVTDKDVIAGTMDITFKTRTNTDTSGDLKEGSAALGRRINITTQ